MLKLVNISKSFDDKVVIENVNMEFKANKISVIIGKSGEGKTTIFRIITNLIQSDSGYVSTDELDSIGMVFQGNELYPHFNVMNNLVIPQRVILKRNKKDAIANAQEVLSKLNISYLSKSFVKSLSGGEAQRVAIARELVMKKNILLLDEPTSALDEENTGILLSLLKELKKDKTIIIITHDMKFATMVADDKFEIKNKKLIKTNDTLI